MTNDDIVKDAYIDLKYIDGEIFKLRQKHHKELEPLMYNRQRIVEDIFYLQSLKPIIIKKEI